MPSPKLKYREITDPAISANQLAQYLNASAHTRKRIIRDARWQSTAVVARYKHARSAIATCLCDLTKSPSTFAKQRIELQNRLNVANISSWTKADLESSIEALDRYAATLNATGLDKLDCKSVTGSVPPLLIGGLRVKVTPDVTVWKGNTAQGESSVGAIVTMIAKGESSTNRRKEQARTAAVLVWMFAEKHLAKNGIPDRKLCFSYDVFDGALIPAGANIANRLNNIQAACEEIALGWHSATPPDDLDS